MPTSEMSTMPIPDLIVLLMISVRIATVLFMTPVFYGSSLPPMVRVLLVLGLSVALAAGQAQRPVGHLSNELFVTSAIIRGIICEFLLGSVMALSILIAFGAFSVAAGLLDVQIGFGMAQVLDPVSQRQTSALTTLFNQSAVVVFFAVNGHQALLRGLVYSLERFPPGQAWFSNNMFSAVLKGAGGLLAMGFSLAAPVIFCLFLVEVALAIVSRNLPQMNVFAMGLPLKVLVGLAALALWQGGIGAVMSRVYASIYSGWADMFNSASNGAGVYG